MDVNKINKSIITFYKHYPLIIKCEYRYDSVEFSYQQIKDINSQEYKNFKYLCSLGYSSYQSNYEYKLLSSKPSFTFLILTTKDSSSLNKNDPKFLNQLLFENLFKTDSQNNYYESMSILLIGSNDGYLYWIPIDFKQVLSNSINLNNFILTNVASKIILIETFLYVEDKNPFEVLFKNKNSQTSLKSKNEDNCLFIITRSGKLHLYSYLTESNYKVCLLPHDVEDCLKYSIKNKDYLIYTTSKNEIFSIELNDCMQYYELKSNFLIKFDSVKKLYRDGFGNILIVNSSGRKIDLDLKKLIEAQNDSKKANLNNQQNIDVSTVKTYLNNLCKKSNQIVNYQLELDRLNIIIKQINQIQNVRLNNLKNDFYFQVDTNFKSKLTLEINVINKKFSVEDSANNFFLLFTCLRFEQFNSDFSKSFYWLNKCEKFKAIKPNMEHITKFETKKLIQSNFYPSKLNIYLIYDIKNFLKLNKENSIIKQNFDSEQINFLNEFTVSIYETEFKFENFIKKFSLESKQNRNELSNNLLLSLIINKPHYFDNRTKIESIWSSICIYLKSNIKNGFLENLEDHLKLNYADKSSYTNKETIFSNLTFGLIVKNSDEESRKENEKNYKFKLDINNHEFNYIGQKFSQNLNNLIFLKNKFILKDILIPYYKANRINHLNQNQLKNITCLKLKLEELNEIKKNETNEPIDQIEIDDNFECNNLNSANLINKKKFYSVDNLLCLIEIYLKLRSNFYSNLNIN